MECYSGQTEEKAEVTYGRKVCSCFAVGLHIDTILQSTSRFPAIHRNKIWAYGVARKALILIQVSQQILTQPKISTG